MTLEPLLAGERATLYLGDSAELDLAPCSIDALVTDPPAGISFMGREWDGDKGGRDQWIAWLGDVLARAFVALKPGAHALVWALPRTSHWTALAVERAGFEIRDVVSHFFGSGFPKSLDVSKAIDERLGAEREPDLYTGPNGKNQVYGSGMGGGETLARSPAATPEGAQWDGWGTALKPAREDWILARKPLASTVAGNVLAFGTGGLNIDATRIGESGGGTHCSNRDAEGRCLGHGNAVMRPTFHAREVPRGRRQGGFYSIGSEPGDPRRNGPSYADGEGGRWPAHVTFDEDAAAILDEQSGYTRPGTPRAMRPREAGSVSRSTDLLEYSSPTLPNDRGDGDGGGASRFFYVAKAPRSEKEQGLDHLPQSTGGEACDRAEGSAGLANPRAGAGRTGGARNTHPTVKGVALMRWLVRLVTPPGGVVLDLFAGSGTTGVAALAEGFRFIGVERDPAYAEIARGRLAHALEACGEDVEPAPPRATPVRSAGPLFDWAQGEK